MSIDTTAAKKPLAAGLALVLAVLLPLDALAQVEVRVAPPAAVPAASAAGAAALSASAAAKLSAPVSISLPIGSVPLGAASGASLAPAAAAPAPAAAAATAAASGDAPAAEARAVKTPAANGALPTVVRPNATIAAVTEAVGEIGKAASKAAATGGDATAGVLSAVSKLFESAAKHEGDEDVQRVGPDVPKESRGGGGGGSGSGGDRLPNRVYAIDSNVIVLPGASVRFKTTMAANLKTLSEAAAGENG